MPFLPVPLFPPSFPMSLFSHLFFPPIILVQTGFIPAHPGTLSSPVQEPKRSPPSCLPRDERHCCQSCPRMLMMLRQIASLRSCPSMSKSTRAPRHCELVHIARSKCSVPGYEWPSNLASSLHRRDSSFKLSNGMGSDCFFAERSTEMMLIPFSRSATSATDPFCSNIANKMSIVSGPLSVRLAAEATRAKICSTGLVASAKGISCFDI